jgi:hypothetical protein
MRNNAMSAAGLGLLLCLAVLATGAARAATAPIYTCTDAKGNKLTSDRPIAECANRDQRLLNPDGSVRKIVPPEPTADERAAAEAAQRQTAAARAAQQEAVRRDRNLMARYPDEASHRRAREAALDDVRKSVRASEERVKTLAAERKPLQAEVEFYAGKPLPAKIKEALDANDAAVAAQRTLAQDQQSEMVRINARFDIELERLQRLWSGAPPGSMGALANVPAPASQASAPSRPASK